MGNKAMNPDASDADDRYSALLSNSTAVRAVASAVEGTIGWAAQYDKCILPIGPH